MISEYKVLSKAARTPILQPPCSPTSGKSHRLSDSLTCHPTSRGAESKRRRRPVLSDNKTKVAISFRPKLRSASQHFRLTFHLNLDQNQYSPPAKPSACSLQISRSLPPHHPVTSSCGKQLCSPTSPAPTSPPTTSSARPQDPGVLMMMYPSKRSPVATGRPHRHLHRHQERVVLPQGALRP